MINLMVVIYSVLSLITLFSSIAAYLIFSGFSFIGLSYIIVYVGAVSILFLFILMLINIRISELQNNTNNSIALAIIIAIYLHIILFIILSCNTGGGILNYPNYSWLEDYKNNIDILSIFINFVYRLISIIWNIADNILYYVSSKTWDANIATDNSHITNIGNIIYSNYSLWILLASLILLLAMVGSIIITINPQSSLKSHSFQSRLSMLIPSKPSFVKYNTMPLMQQKRQASGGGHSSSMDILQDLALQAPPVVGLEYAIAVAVGLITTGFAYLWVNRIIGHDHSLNNLQEGINANNRLLGENPIVEGVLPEGVAPEYADENVIPEVFAFLSNALDYFQADMMGFLVITSGSGGLLNQQYVDLIPEPALSMMGQGLARLRGMLAQLGEGIIPALEALVTNLRGRFEYWYNILGGSLSREVGMLQDSLNNALQVLEDACTWLHILQGDLDTLLDLLPFLANL